MDSLTLKPLPLAKGLSWIYCQVEISVNDAPLLPLIARSEVGHLEFPGDYHYPMAGAFHAHPTMGLAWQYIRLQPHDDYYYKHVVLGAGRGPAEEGSILASIELVDESAISWNGFCRFPERDIVYDVGPFLFSKESYLAEVVRAISEVRRRYLSRQEEAAPAKPPEPPEPPKQELLLQEIRDLLPKLGFPGRKDA